jgi:AcrR family transcriptional regulator
MKEQTVDRRIQKTKKALTEALIQLILENGYEKVTIQDITDKANVGRSTFYSHYESKEQLLFDGPNNLNVRMFDGIDQTDDIEFLSLFNHIAENRTLAQSMLLKRGGCNMYDFFQDNIALKIRKKYKPRFGRDSKNQKVLDFMAQASASAVMSLLICWLEDDMVFSANEMSARCRQLVASIFEQSVAKPI